MRDYRICGRCLAVDGGGWSVPEYCLGRYQHRWLPAEVTECPFITRTATGQVADESRRQADRECGQVQYTIHAGHNYRDLERRHFRVPAEWAGTP